MRQLACATAVLIGFIAMSSTADAQSQPPEDGSIARWRDRPSFQFGDLRLDLRLKVARDWRRFDPDIAEEDGIWRLRRGGINGEIGDHVEFQIERDLIEDGDWRDVFVRWNTYRQAQVSAGRFKVPFGREQNVSSSSIDFAARALVSDVVAPGRDKGVMVNGRFLSRGLTYEAGVFNGDGDNGRLREEQFAVGAEIEDIGPSFAARVTGTPLRRLAETFETLRVGFAYGGTSVPEGLNSLRGESLYGTVRFFEPVYVNGRRTRMGVEFTYTPGPVGLTAEWMQSRDERKRQGLGDVDLSDLVITGWYTAATWLVTGEDKENFENPRNPLFDGGIGALELAVRYERFGFESAEKIGPAFANPRAEHILPNSDQIWTFGVNWFANRWVRATVNLAREEFEDALRTPQPGASEFWSALGRLQFVF